MRKDRIKEIFFPVLWGIGTTIYQRYIPMPDLVQVVFIWIVVGLMIEIKFLAIKVKSNNIKE